jgi:hypothetical protein
VYVFFSIFLYNLLTHLDNKDENKVLHAIADDLITEICALWDNLPIDTVIATFLDPRTKSLPQIPKVELEEALKILKKVSF